MVRYTTGEQLALIVLVPGSSTNSGHVQHARSLWRGTVPVLALVLVPILNYVQVLVPYGTSTSGRVQHCVPPTHLEASNHAAVRTINIVL